MGQALYRKYRSKSLSEIVGQEHVTTTLANAIKQGRISHAYLLSGPRGVGKTSIARIIAHEINGLPYSDEAVLDIIEIDAASNRRIDEIREIRDRVNVAPANAKYKVYIIDEVHMLTREAFNALLKTLEEPPAHVVFILATTEAHKLPETILSRTQRFTLRPVPHDQVVAHLKHIAESEKIVIDDDALDLIARHGEGSFRDSISLLDQAGSVSGHITRADIERVLGLAPDDYISRLNTALAGSDPAAVVATLGELYAAGYEPAMIAQQVAAAVRTDILENRTPDRLNALNLLGRLIDVPASRNPRALLEITLLQTMAAPAAAAHTPAPATASAAPVRPAAATVQKTAPAALVIPDKPAVPAQTPEDPPAVDNPAPEVTPLPEGDLDATELWHEVLEAIKKQYNTLYGIARMAHPELAGNTLTLTLKFVFHQKRLNEVKNRELLSRVVEKLAGRPIEIVCVVGETAGNAAAPDVSAISNIFGGAELLNS